MTKKRATIITFAAIAAILLIARVAAPYLIKDYVNQLLATRENYSGSVSDVGLALWRGAYRVEGMLIVKKGGDPEAPFFRSEAIDFSLEWGALLSGALVGEAVFERPELRLGQNEDTGEEQLGQDGDWLAGLESLMPMRVNRLQAIDGTVSYGGTAGAALPQVTVTHVDLLATNLTNARKSEEESGLPSSLSAQGVAQDDAQLSVRGSFDLMSSPMDLDIDLACEPLSLAPFNPILRDKLALDVKSGAMGFYGEWLVRSGQLDGYLKFVVENLDILDISEDAKNPLNLLWQAIAGFFTTVTENPSRKQFATRIPLSGEVGDVEAGIWPALGSIFVNAFVSAFTRDVDESVGAADPEAAAEK